METTRSYFLKQDSTEERTNLSSLMTAILVEIGFITQKTSKEIKVISKQEY